MEAESIVSTPHVPPKQLPKGSVSLQIIGDLILARCSEPVLNSLFKRFEDIFEAYANMEKSERILNYKLLSALMLTSYAKKTLSAEEKRRLFAMKNNMFFSLASNSQHRRLLSLKYLIAENFRVASYCSDCLKSNTQQKEPKHRWKHCQKCEIDHDFYNIISMTHQYRKGFIRIYLSNDQAAHLPFGKPKARGRLSDSKEGAFYGVYRYNAKNLDAIDFPSVIRMYEKFVDR